MTDSDLAVAEPETTRPPRMFDAGRQAARAFGGVFRNPRLRRQSLALAASMIGDWAFAVAVSVWSYREQGAAALGLYGVARWTSMACLSPLVATTTDRFPRVRVMVTADVIRAIAVATGALLIAVHGPALAVYALALLAAVVSCAFRAAQAALLPTLAHGAAELGAANVVVSTTEGLGIFAGPALAGFVLAVSGVEAAFLVNAASFVVSALLLAGIAAPHETVAGDEEHDRSAGQRGHDILQRVAAGFAPIRSDRHLRLVMQLMLLQSVLAGASLVYEVSIAFDLLDLGDSGVGWLGSALGVGCIAGGGLALVMARNRRTATDFGVGVIGWSAPLVVVALFPWIAPTFIAMFLIGLANPLVDANAATIVQRIVSPDVMGRVFGVMQSLTTAGMAVGALLMPALLRFVGLRWGLVLIGGSVVAITLLAMPALRRLDTVLCASLD